MRPDKYWGPPLVKHRVKVCHLKNFDIDPDWIGSLKQPAKLQGGNTGVSIHPMFFQNECKYH